MMSTQVTVPINFKRELFLINDELVDRKFVKLSLPVLPETVDLKIENETHYIYDYQFQVIKVSESNINSFPTTQVGDYVVCWRDNFTADCELLSDIVDETKLGKFLEITYVSTEEQIEVPSSSTSDDDVDWEATQHKFYIVIESSSGGVVTPSGTIYVNQGDNLILYFSPDPGKRVSAVYIDGVDIGSVPTYTLENITSAHTVRAEFGVQQVWLEIIE